jgi:hypothetical protein
MNLNGVSGRVMVVTAERSPMMLDSMNCMPLLPPLHPWYERRHRRAALLPAACRFRRAEFRVR